MMSLNKDRETSQQKSLVAILFVMTTLLMLAVPAASAAGSVSAASLIGLVYHDTDCDGAYGLTSTGMEPSISGVPVSLYIDDAPYGALGVEDVLIDSRSTNTDGYVVFPGVPSGRYLINIKPPKGFLALTPTTQEVGVDGDAGGAIVEWMFGVTPRESLSVRRYLPTIGG